MQKIVVRNKGEQASLCDVFSPSNRQTVWKSLTFMAKSIRASRIRCYAMNFLSSSEYLTTTH